DNAAYMQDSQQYTVMSYFCSANTGAQFHGYSASTPLLHDVAALQYIYGANMTTRTGDTTYGFHSNADRDAFDFTIDTNPIIAIWDAGGHDCLDLSGFTSVSHVDLNEGAFSSCNSLADNIAIAYGTTIEDATTGPSKDVLVGNSSDNVLN